MRALLLRCVVGVGMERCVMELGEDEMPAGCAGLVGVEEVVDLLWGD